MSLTDTSSGNAFDPSSSFFLLPSSFFLLPSSFFLLPLPLLLHTFLVLSFAGSFSSLPPITSSSSQSPSCDAHHPHPLSNVFALCTHALLRCHCTLLIGHTWRGSPQTCVCVCWLKYELSLMHVCLLNITVRNEARPVVAGSPDVFGQAHLVRKSVSGPLRCSSRCVEIHFEFFKKAGGPPHASTSSGCRQYTVPHTRAHAQVFSDAWLKGLAHLLLSS